MGGLAELLAQVALAWALTVSGPQMAQPAPSPAAVGGIGQFVATGEIDGDGCPAERRDVFREETVIYVAAERSEIEAGDVFHARTYRGGLLVDESVPIQAESDMLACVWFQLTPTGDGFLAGHYMVELVRNGVAVDWAQFAVAE